MIFENPEKRDIFYEGVWCLAHKGSSEYTALHKYSQNAVTWASQQAYGHNMVYFCIVIIFLFILKRLVFNMIDNSSKTGKTSSSFSKKLTYKISTLNRWISYRRLPKLLCEIFQLPSSLGNFIIIMLACLYVLCYTFIPKFWYRGCRGFGSPPLAVRAGLESTSLVPLIIILSGKTNIISQLTDISYEKLNVYHRWVSTICCFLGWVHTVPFYVQAVKEGGMSNLAKSQKADILYTNGIPPLVFLTILTVFSHSYIRALWYELWLQIHWICAIGFYVSLFIHCYPELNSWKYLVATLVFWFTQLIWRAVNKSMLRPNKGFLRSNKCKMRKFISNGEKNNFFEIIIENSNDFFWVPGQHVFLRIPGLRFLENHPFSIVSSYKLQSDSNDIKLIVKSTTNWGGMTGHIYCKLPDSGYTESNIFIDGPYGGCSRPVNAFNNVYLMASGTGVSAIISFLEDACDKMEKNDGIINYIRFDWIIKSSENVEWIFPELQTILTNHSNLIKNNLIDINIHIKEDIEFSNTEIFNLLKEDENNLSSETSSQNKKEVDDSNYAGNDLKLINIHNVRPDVTKILQDTRKTLSKGNIFIVSGSDSMKVSVSNSVASLQREVLKGNSKVEEIYLHTESFGW